MVSNTYLCCHLCPYSIILPRAAMNNKCRCTNLHITDFLEGRLGCFDVDDVVNVEEPGTLEEWDILQ